MPQTQYLDLLMECCTGYRSCGNQELLYNACEWDLYSGLVPKVSIKMKWEYLQNQEGLELQTLEEVLKISIIPFMTICDLSVGG